MSLLKRFFARPSGDTRVLTGPGGPLTLVGREGDDYFERASLKRLSESTLSGLLDRGVRGAGAALDVGANIGLTTVLIARHGEGAVYAFEPHPPTFACLGKTIAANGLANAHAVNLALGREEGELPFFVDSDSSASHVVSPQAGGRTGSIIVPISTVDAFAATIDGPVTFMKIERTAAFRWPFDLVFAIYIPFHIAVIVRMLLLALGGILGSRRREDVDTHPETHDYD